jgi:tRNA(adenine34) deaminase
MATRQPKKKAESQYDQAAELKISDEFFMACALVEARQAGQAGEVPVGAVVVFDNRIVGRGFNQSIGSRDPAAHAEIIALREAAHQLGNYRLTDATVYVTIEPCVMCAGALVNARIKRLVYGAPEERFGAVASLFQLCTHSSLNHRMEVVSGVLADECRALLQSFFKQRRKNNV